MTSRAEPAAFDGEYEEIQPLLRHIRIMQRFFHEVIDADPDYRKHCTSLHIAYMNILGDELTPPALT